MDTLKMIVLWVVFVTIAAWMCYMAYEITLIRVNTNEMRESLSDAQNVINYWDTKLSE